MKNFFAGIVFLFLIKTFVDIFSNVLTVIIATVNASGYFIIAGELLFYLIIVYFLFFRLKSIPKFNIWIVLLAFLYCILPKTFIYTYVLNLSEDIPKIFELERFLEHIFILTLAIIAYVKYYRINQKSLPKYNENV